MGVCWGIPVALILLLGRGSHASIRGEDAPYLFDNQTDYFDEEASTTFVNLSIPFDERFYDSSGFAGWKVKDVLWFGKDGDKGYRDSWVRTADSFQWGLVTSLQETNRGATGEWQKLQHAGVDGLLGLGCPLVNGSDVAMPLFRNWSLAGRPLPQVFSIHLTSIEQQALKPPLPPFLAIGGYENHAYAEPKWVTTHHSLKRVKGCSWDVKVKQIYYANAEELEWAEAGHGKEWYKHPKNCIYTPGKSTKCTLTSPETQKYSSGFHALLTLAPDSKGSMLGLMDSGSSCLMLPTGSTLGPSQIDAFTAFERILANGNGQYTIGSAFWVVFEDEDGGEHWEAFPVSEFAQHSGQLCVRSSNHPGVLIMGMPFFRRKQVIFDYETDKNRARVGFAEFDVNQVGKQHTREVGVEPVKMGVKSEGKKIWATVQAHVGTPKHKKDQPQGPMSLILDTGSATIVMFGVPNESVVGEGGWELKLEAIWVGAGLVLVLLIGVVLCCSRRKSRRDYSALHFSDGESSDGGESQGIAGWSDEDADGHRGALARIDPGAPAFLANEPGPSNSSPSPSPSHSPEPGQPSEAASPSLPPSRPAPASSVKVGEWGSKVMESAIDCDLRTDDHFDSSL